MRKSQFAVILLMFGVVADIVHAAVGEVLSKGMLELQKGKK